MRGTIRLAFTIIEKLEPELTLGSNLDLDAGDVEEFAMKVSGLVSKLDPKKKQKYEHRMEASSIHS